MKTSVLFILLLSCCCCFGQTGKGTIEGRVTSNGKPVEFANVGLVGISIGATTNKNGYFIIKIIPFGQYELRVSAIGYEKWDKKITIADTSAVSVRADIKEVAAQLGEVVVSGTMKETYTALSPIKVEVYTPALFKKNPAPSLFESMNMINGVQPTLYCSICNTGDIHINGMEGPYTMITIDGMPIVSGLSTVYGLHGIPNSLVQRVEVVKGPASTLYGSEAVGGLINIITKNPSNTPVISLDAFATSHREYNTDLSLKTKIKKAHALIGMNYYNFNNRMDENDDNFTDVTLQNRISIFNKWRLDRKNNRLATLAARYVYEDRFGGELQWKPEFRGTDSIYGESIYTTRYELIGAYQLPLDKEKITFQFSYNNHYQNSAYGTTLFNAQQQIVFAQLLWDKRWGTKHDLIAGIPFRYIFYDDNTVGTQSTDGKNQVQSTYLPGIFVQDEIKLSSRLTTLAGLRYDHNTTHGNIFSPRTSFKYAPDSFNVFRLSGGNGYRVVNLFTEDHAALTGAREVVIKGALKPEQSYNVNFNYQRYITHKKGFIGLDASVFYTYFTNKIVGDYFSNDNQIIYNNLGGYAVSKGITVNADYSFTSSLKIILGVTGMKVFRVNQDNEGQWKKSAELFAPPFSANFSLSYLVKKLGVNIDYTGKIYSPMLLPVVQNDYRPDHSPWFSMQNIQLTRKLEYGLEIYGGIKNLLNFRPRADVILRPFDPFDKHLSENNPNNYTFDPSYIYAPMQGIRGFIGLRWSWN